MANIGKLMKQAQQMQRQMAQLQEEIATKTVEGSSGGGVVKVVARGDQSIESIKIDPKAVDPDDVEMLEDLILTAVKSALNQAKELSNDEMGKLTGGMNLPGMM
ncbi:MAG TPA: YbaB/EbfC family nucleoid-associated protein [Verrucomicrobiales bacterium]|jgi:hypothetical protein|nr:YbaB/EbfC family nucleoid-associated protein [Verrucomicrobiales bacterium]HIL70749.1 YbaB/EbfC family nucleoid-associated protein [Verrucomicrobiota bacterium]